MKYKKNNKRNSKTKQQKKKTKSQKQKTKRKQPQQKGGVSRAYYKWLQDKVKRKDEIGKRIFKTGKAIYDLFK